MLPAPCFLPLPERRKEEGGETDMPKFPTEPVSESRPSAGMKAETKKCDFDPLSLGEVLETSRFMLTMKMPFWTPKCHAKKCCFEQVTGQRFGAFLKD